jgi:uncharacterized repeat protein (TIGR03847 family)
MSDYFHLPEVATFDAVAIGPAGQRVFYLHATGEFGAMTLKLEKQQVMALADALEQVLEAKGIDAATAAGQPGAGPAEPVDAAWVVGTMGVGVDASESDLVVVAEELVDEDDADADEEPGRAEVHLSAEQAAGFIAGARVLAGSGRDLGRRNGHKPS